MISTLRLRHECRLGTPSVEVCPTASPSRPCKLGIRDGPRLAGPNSAFLTGGLPGLPLTAPCSLPHLSLSAPASPALPDRNAY